MRKTIFLTTLIIFFVLPLAVFALFTIAPGWRYPDILPAKYDLRSLHLLASQWKPVLTSLLSSTLYSLCTVALALLLCIIPARHFARNDFPGKALAEGLLLAPALVPSMAFSMGVHHTFIFIGLTDTFIGLVLVLTTFSYPYMLRALVAGFQAVDREYADCARNLGASPVQTFVQIELPMLLPAMAAGGSVVFLAAFSEYFLVFLIGGGAVPSYTGYLFPYLNSSDLSMGSLLTLLFLLVPLALFIAIELLLGRRRWNRLKLS